jgi:hypothetical protein
LEEIDHGLAFGGARSNWNFIGFELKNAAASGEEEQVFVSSSGKERFYRVFFFGGNASYAFAAAGLGFEGVRGETLYIAVFGNNDDDALIRDQIFLGEFVRGILISF